MPDGSWLLLQTTAHVAAAVEGWIVGLRRRARLTGASPETLPGRRACRPVEASDGRSSRSVERLLESSGTPTEENSVTISVTAVELFSCLCIVSYQVLVRLQLAVKQGVAVCIGHFKRSNSPRASRGEFLKLRRVVHSDRETALESRRNC